MERLALVVLAAGASTRMGHPKPLIELAGRPLLKHLLSVPLLEELGDVVVVLGYHSDAILPVVKHCERRHVINPEPDMGRTGSIQIGLRSISDQIEAVFVQPIDCPLVLPDTYRRLARERRDTDVAVPAFAHKTGHPPLLSVKLFSRILSAEPDRPLRDLLHAPDVTRQTVQDDDPGVLLNVDRPGDIEELKNVYADYQKRMKTC